MRRISRFQVATEGNRIARPVHPKPRMRKIVKIGGVFGATLLLLWMTGVAGVISDRLFFYGQIASLYTQEPESRIAMPLQDVTTRQVADTWDAPRGVGRRHEGQDIFAPKGTPILSATNGYIHKIGENNLGGQTVSVIGSGGRVYYYAHLDSYGPNLEVGDRVSTRTVLGYVGTTGNAQGTPPHLHFGIYTFTGAINPLPLLKDRTAPALTRESPPQNRSRRRFVSRRA